MSVHFRWPQFDKKFIQNLQESIESSVRIADKPPSIASEVKVIQLYLGTIPPNIEILDISEFEEDRIAISFSIEYQGDASLHGVTSLQINPLYPLQTRGHRMASHRFFGLGTAHKPLVAPLDARLHLVRLRGVADLKINPNIGVEFRWRSNPLQSMALSSNFERCPLANEPLFRQICELFENLLMDTLPYAIHLHRDEVIEMTRKLSADDRQGKQEEVGEVGEVGEKNGRRYSFPKENQIK